MPYATNPIDHVRTFFENPGRNGSPVLVYPGFADPLEYAQASPLAQALREDFRLIFADHRGQGRSDKPHEVASYALITRVADAVAILRWTPRFDPPSSKDRYPGISRSGMSRASSTRAKKTKCARTPHGRQQRSLGRIRLAPGHTHFSAERVAHGLLPRVLELFRSAEPSSR